ncbi:hypothetical protein B7P43_G02341 [Cryptotermes secundus]|uniref:HAUS augmin-like complex subunit 3 N-terminal domain-containing protein n=1 Tax=Cryptotermes secundus TaxID=105785 RepID=A0A2J7PT24_9NEOP|nr:uncharacterized protein LOC111872034 [Cryptotermes secundus]PNF19482.1 hypothetical protein B7P43_G02341 [Cryptotermes secundus]
MLDSSGPDLMHILKEMANEMQNLSVQSSFSDDDNVRDFMAQLCNIDSRNFLTPAELLEYDAMIEAGEVLHGKELDASIEFFTDSLQETEDDNNCFITEELEMADSHIRIVTDLQETLNKEILHVRSGMRQLEQQENAAHYSLLAEEQHCIELHSRVYSAQEELLKRLQCLKKLSTDFKNVKSAPQLVGQLPLEAYRKRCFQFSHSIKMMMKQCLEWNESSAGEYEDDHLEELEQSFVEMKMEYLYMLASYQGKKASIGKLKDIMNDIQTSKFPFSFNEIRSQSLLLEEKVNGDKEQISLMCENEVLPAVEQAVEMDVLQIKKYRNDHKLCKLERIFKQNNSLARCLEAGLTDSELLLLLLVCERQKIVDMADLYQQCHQVINEEYLQFTSRMKTMQELRKDGCSYSLIMENPLVQCLGHLFSDEHSAKTGIHGLMRHVENLNKDIINQEEKLFNSLFNKQKSVSQYENSIKTAKKYLCSGLTKRPVLLKMEISTCCSNIEQLLESFQEVLKQIKDNYKRKQVYFSEKPFLQEQRLLWIHFLMDPKKLVALIEHLQELTEKRINYNILKYQKIKRRETSFFPQRMQK